WTGFPLRKLIEKCAPTSKATHVAFISADKPDEMPGIKNAPWYDWPYFEGLRLGEAMNDMAFMATGMYGEPLPKQNGSPMRLVLPWKYGYKGPKAVVELRFVNKEPPTFWNKLQPAEYGFVSNVNPNVPHPRWSQATERYIQSEVNIERRDTFLFNGYAEQVGSLYPDEPTTLTRKIR
ncbi:MAG: sulfoxide reductase catalytic subunit YedY, partial [Rhodothermales bacterium]